MGARLWCVCSIYGLRYMLALLYRKIPLWVAVRKLSGYVGTLLILYVDESHYLDKEDPMNTSPASPTKFLSRSSSHGTE